MKHSGTKRPPLNLRSGVYLCILVQLTISANLPLPTPQIIECFGKERLEEPSTAANKPYLPDKLTSKTNVENQTDASDLSVTTIKSPVLPTPTPCSALAPSPPESLPHLRHEYPEDLFSHEVRRRGWVILHIVGFLYLFLALAVVCNEFFVPAVKVIAEKLSISDDVAGATVMAAGKSIPKFVGFVIGVVVAESDVAIGTIVGPAVYNVVFVIGMCALFSREMIRLTWSPFVRDMSFYIFLLTLIMTFYLDHDIMWWESMILIAGYIVYMIFMKFDARLQGALKNQLYKYRNIVKFTAVGEREMDDGPAGEHESRGSEDSNTERDDSRKKSDDCCENGNDEYEKKEEEEAMVNKPLSLKWPETPRERAAYLFLLPIVLPLWLTVPDVRNQKSRRFCVITLLASILWIMVLMYFIFWLGHQVGDTVGIPHQITALLVGGLANPNLITSVIVARQGLGDMAVSSTVGTNIFDITVGLPVSWLLLSSIHGSASVPVNSTGLVCACVLLFLMLLFAIVLLLSCKWRMTKVLGSSMIMLYVVFLVISLLLQYDVIVCPVNI